VSFTLILTFGLDEYRARSAGIDEEFGESIMMIKVTAVEDGASRERIVDKISRLTL